MAQPTAAKNRQYHALIIDFAHVKALLLETGGRWSLPCMDSTNRDVFAGGPLSAWVKSELGLEVTQLRVAAIHSDPTDTRWDWALLVLEKHDAVGTLPQNARWVGREELLTLQLTPAEFSEKIDEVLAEIENGVEPVKRSPWVRPGWWEPINSWVAGVLADQGRALIDGLEQRKVWSISTLLHGETAEGAVYVKGCATLPLFTNEAAIAAELAKLFPGQVPTPLAVDRERRWILLNDFGGYLLDNAPHEDWFLVVDAYAELQKSTGDKIDQLLAAGCLDRRLDKLLSALPALLDGVRELAPLEPDELERFAQALPGLEAGLRELAALPIPATLIHGDLHQRNIAIIDGKPLFFDWSDAAISHPLFDLPTLLFYFDTFDDMPTERAALLDRYLSHWTDFVPAEELSRVAKLAVLVGNLHHVKSYVEIVRHVEPASRWEYEDGITDFVRNVLRQLDQR